MVIPADRPFREYVRPWRGSVILDRLRDTLGEGQETATGYAPPARTAKSDEGTITLLPAEHCPTLDRVHRAKESNRFRSLTEADKKKTQFRDRKEAKTRRESSGVIPSRDGDAENGNGRRSAAGKRSECTRKATGFRHRLFDTSRDRDRGDESGHSEGGEIFPALHQAETLPMRSLAA